MATDANEPSSGNQAAKPAGVLAADAMNSLRQFAHAQDYQAQETIVRRGDTGTAFYIVLSGQLEIVLTESGRQLALARLGTGASFGEMSLLTGAPVSADVVAVSDVTLLAISAEKFRQALGASEALRDHVLGRLSADLRRTSSEAWDLFQRTEALSCLMHGADTDEPAVAESAAMRRTEKQIAKLSSESTPVLITGEPGTGKFFFAGRIHRTDPQDDRPMIVLDCRQLTDGQAMKVLFGAARVTDFAASDSRSAGSQLQVQGALHLADGGSIVLRHIEKLEPDAQRTLAAYLDARAADNVSPNTRVIATTTADLPWLVKGDLFDETLAEHLARNTLEIPPLRKRKRDIIALAAIFAKGISAGQPAATFSKSAENALLSGGYQHRNVTELREAVELAVSFADANQVEAEHIFTGPKSETSPLEVDLTPNKLVQFATRRMSLRILQAMVLAFFSAIIILCFTAGQTLPGRIANTLVWALWWPGLLILFLFIGRLWCTVCPISAVGRIARLLKRLEFAPPAWMKDYAGWTMAFLFLVIVWVEHVFKMTHTPFATAILLLGLMSLPVIFGILFQRESWCRYLCPLGSLAAGYSVCSTVQVHANPNVCASKCTTHECFKGSAEEPGCPVFHHPLYVRDAHFCKLCFTCLRSCPHQSARLYLHPPLQNLWRIAELGGVLIPFALIVFFESLVLLASHKVPFVKTDTGFTLITVGAVAAAAMLYAALAGLFARDRDPALVSRIAFALLVLGWGPFMAFHLDNIPELDAIIIRAADASPLNPILNVSLLIILQFLAVLLSTVFTAICLYAVAARRKRTAEKVNLISLTMLAGICTAYLLATILLILR